ncbi:MAG: hypothetical protein R2754_00485 [Microthrixaceae bacterium]
MSWSSASTCEAAADGIARCPGGELALRRAAGPRARARGLVGDAAWLDASLRPPMGLWLGRTPQVHTFGMASAVAVLTLTGGQETGAAGSMRVESTSVLSRGRLGRWRWRWPPTLELRPELLGELGLTPGASLDVSWDGGRNG